MDATIKRGDIFYTDLGKGVGCEQGGERPVIIIQNDVGNKYSPTIIVASITSQLTKAKLPTHVEISKGEGGLTKDSVILLEQIRTLDKRRLQEKVGHVNNEKILNKIDNASLVSIGIPTNKDVSISSQIKNQIENENNNKEESYSEEMIKVMKNKLKEMESVINNSRKKKACFIIDENMLDIIKCACSIVNNKNECCA